MASGSAGIGTPSEEEMTLSVKWAGKDFTVRVCADDTVGELKRRICEVTNVLPKRQKLLNVKAGTKPATDASFLSQLNLKPGIKIMMMGYIAPQLSLLSWVCDSDGLTSVVMTLHLDWLVGIDVSESPQAER